MGAQFLQAGSCRRRELEERPGLYHDDSPQRERVRGAREMTASH